MATSGEWKWKVGVGKWRVGEGGTEQYLFPILLYHLEMVNSHIIVIFDSKLN